MSDFLEDNNSSQQQQVAQNSLNNPVISVTQRKNSDVGLIAGEFLKCLDYFGKNL
jgi:hypothetical protein